MTRASDRLQEAATGRVGPYRITSRLGEGGMGVVYRARHDERQEDVALKTLALDSWDASLVDSIRREIRALAQLIELAPCRDERVLRDVLAECQIAGAAITHRTDYLLVAFDQRAERFTLATPARFQELSVRYRDRLSHVSHQCSELGPT